MNVGMMPLMGLLSVLLAGAGLAQQPAATMDPAKILPVTLGLLPPAGTAPEALLIKSGDRVAFIGDSITAYGGYVRLTAYVLKVAYPELKLPQFISAGVSGQKAEGMAPRFEKDMQLTNAPTWIFISVGMILPCLRPIRKTWQKWWIRPGRPVPTPCFWPRPLFRKILRPRGISGWPCMWRR